MSHMDTAFTGKTAGIILAAGTGSRMGTVKQLLPFRNTTILGAVVQAALDADLDPLILVLGHEADKIEAALSRQIIPTKIQVVYNPDYAMGQSSSLIAGIKRLPAHTGGAMFLLGDQPLISALTLNRLVSAYQGSDAGIIIPFYNGRRGNPVIIGKKHFHLLKTLTADTGARVLFNQYPEDTLKVNVDDPGILTDIDTPDDYSAMIKSGSS